MPAFSIPSAMDSQYQKSVQVWYPTRGTPIPKDNRDLVFVMCEVPLLPRNTQHRHRHIPDGTRHNLLWRLFTGLC